MPPTADPAAPVTFADLGLPDELLTALTALGYEEPTPIQREAIPPLMEGRDLLGQAATGTGKTAAFALPILERMATVGDRGTTAPLALVLVPTRELAMQVSEAVHKYGRALGARVLPVYGGQPIGRQLQGLGRGVDVVVATPGRAVDHIKRRSLVLDDVALVVLDEADEMLDMGFAEDLEAILGATPPTRQTVLFSATLPSRIAGLAKRHMSDPVKIQIAREAIAEGEAPKVRQTAYVVRRADKAAALGRILDVEAPGAAIVFCRTRGEVDELTETLNGRGYRAEGLHGGMSQEQRDRVMGRLRSRTADLLIATDVAARGLDVDHLTHVVNYDVPSAPESYVHRIGRVGRAGREGVAITLAEPREHRQLKNIERLTKQQVSVEKVPTVADLRNKRIEMTLATLRDTLVADDLDHYRSVVETLCDEFDVMEVALAAVKLAHEATGAVEDDREIAEVSLKGDKPSGYEGKKKWDKPGKGDKGTGTTNWANRAEYEAAKKGKKNKKNKHTGSDMTTVFVGAGKESGVRPQDLVGAFTGETELRGADIGAIKIFDRFSLVEVPDQAVDDVVHTMGKALIKGRKAKVRRERERG
ncbi:DEAD/DEAH box helicase [Rhabdothermincola salaria]|uniref:DEAD/DEAH box helicase n=1 Tax=Rhabdothermincola salaria TaxID=2903142 RepID=UPI001E3110E4|nr:DEAD/DEAH box helicase [Rhabdothermincola salaria]MCD9624095.1 DEAD/DEAH box helicase [Rhabdothermincola salaria]